MGQMRTMNFVGMKCPQPILRLHTLFKNMSEGDQVIATADDPAFPLDVAAWCKKTGHELLQLDTTTDLCTATIRKNL